MREAPFRITFPIEKAETRGDGHYLVGIASGPEMDSEGERMAPEAIARFAAQINEGGIPLTYRDAHLKDGVLRDLGEVTRAWVTPEFHLGIEVRLDTDTNAAAESLWKQITLKGKQYGMSVAGKVLDYVDEFVADAGHIVRTYKNVVLTEISNTTRPAWTPSFGTVLAKAVKDAEEENDDTAGAESGVAKGDSLSMDEELQSTQETSESAAEKADVIDIAEEIINAEIVDETGEPDDEPEKSDDAVEPEAEKAEEPVETVEEPEKAADEETEPVEEAEKAPESESEDVEKAGRAISQANSEKLRAAYTTLTATLTELGILSDESEAVDSTKSVSQDESETLSKALAERDERITAQDAEIADLKKSLAEAAARIEELEKTPAVGNEPELLAERREAEDVLKSLSTMSPGDRLRAGLRARYGR